MVELIVLENSVILLVVELHMLVLIMHVCGFKMNTTSNAIKTPVEINVIIFQINAHVDAPIVVVQHTSN